MQQTNAAGGIIALDEADDEDEDEDEEDDAMSGVAAPSSGMRSYSFRAAINMDQVEQTILFHFIGIPITQHN